MSHFNGKYFLSLFCFFVLLAPADGISGFVSVYLHLSDENYRILRYVLSLIIFLAVVSKAEFLPYLIKCIPLLMVIGCNFLTYFWALDKSWTLIQSMVMATAVIAAASIATLYRLYFIESIVHLSILIVFSSLFLALFFPDVGTLSSFQLEQASLVGDTGSWLGIFSSKNALGHGIGICAAIIFVYGKAIFNKWLYYFSLFCSFVCVYQSKSASGIVIFISGITFFFLMSGLIKRKNLINVFYYFIVAVVISFFGNDIIAYSLEFLGKDATFTGRDEIWEYGRAIIYKEALPWGFGYGYSWNLSFLMEILGVFNVVHLHSAYLELLLNNGLFALVFFGLHVWVLFVGFRKWMNGSTEAGLCLVILFMWMVSGFSEPNIIRPSGFFSFIGFVVVAEILLISVNDEYIGNLYAQ